VKTIAVHIRESEKGDRDLTLQNLRDEIVGFMYRQTVSRSTKADMQFYILLFYASIAVKDKTAIEAILDEGIPKFKRFTLALTSGRGYLRRNEYAELKEQYGLDELFYKDLFFVIMGAVLNIDEIRSRFQDVIRRDQLLSDALDRLKQDYYPQLQPLFETFSGSKIEGTRIDDNGNVHDLSKSVYRTVYMRSSRNLELNLQKYTSVKKIESNSPIDFTFLQHIDPNTLIHLWDKYNVAHYMVSVIKTISKAAGSNLGSNIIGGLIVAYIAERRINGAEDRKAKNAAKTVLEIEKSRHQKELDELNAKLVQSVLDSNRALSQEVRHLKNKQLAEARKSRAVRDEELLKSLSQRINRLEKLVVTSEIQDDDDKQPTLFN
jgi:hypothetical protein